MHMLTGISKRRLLSLSLAAVTALSGLQVATPPASADPGRQTAPSVPADRPAARGTTLKTRQPDSPDQAAKAALTRPPAVTPVTAGSAEVIPGRATRFGGLGVGLGAKARVQVLDAATAQKAGVGGTLFRVDSGRTGLALDYRGLADAYGGDYGARLRLLRVPDCALTTPGAKCAPVEVPATNNTAARTVTADIAGGLFALAAAQDSAQGSYTATKIAASSKWSVAGSSGALSWSYPMDVPPVPGSFSPQIALSYNSQAVDGRTAATNNQGSWIGEGFTYEPGYIERSYKSCKDDGHDSVGDLCWARYNGSIVLNGASYDMVRITDDEWKLAKDDGTRIKRLTGAVNGDNDGEFWQVTAPNGTQYVYGQNRLPGWVANKEETNSTWSVPVFGDDKDEPCYNATFANAWCRQAWRWNLDYVKDSHGNVVSYYYGKETNYYAKGAKTDVNGTSYDRGGYLKRIDYGQRHNAVYTTNAPARVQFAIAERCIPTDTVKCGADDLKTSTAANWPDVPWDQNCAADTKCKIEQSAPTFWTRKRLTAVTTEIRSGGAWNPADTWSLDQIFTDNGDGSRSLWLRNIDHEGRAGGSAKVPSVSLAGIQLPNRIAKPDDNIGGLIRFRLATVWSDAGAQLDVTYAPADCSAGDLPKEGESTRRCFPVKWHPNSSDKEPVTDWFHKYVVSDVVETDLISRSPDMVRHYDYIGGAGWRKTKPDGITESKYLTYSDWRGYGEVREYRGSSQQYTQRTDSIYLRGLEGDPVKDSTGGSHPDTDEFAGTVLEEKHYDGAKVADKIIADPWMHVSATQSETWGKLEATMVRPETVRTLTALAAGGWRETRQTTTYDTTYGVATKVDDLGDIATDADDQCVRTTYTGAGSGPVSLVSEVETVAVKCAATPDRRTQVLTDVRTYYDKLALGAAPTEGNATKTEEIKSHDGKTATYTRAGEKTYDSYGRTLTETDAAGTVTRTEYTQTEGLTTRTKVTNAVGHETITELNPAWGVATATIDANLKRTDLGYDPLGRLTAVWLPDRSKLAGNTASVKFTYLHRKDLGVTVETEQVNSDGSYRASYELYDGHLRLRQTQQPGPENGRLVSETIYSATGDIAKENAQFFAAGKPADRIQEYDNGDAAGQTLHEYDGLGRETALITAVNGTEKWRTTTTYGGDRVTVDPPAGSPAKTTLLDARDHAVELRQYHSSDPAGAYDTTRYEYDAAGQLTKVTDAANNQWTSAYDQRGRRIRSTDPDSGATDYQYDEDDRPTYSKDAEGRTLTTTYDDLGRKTTQNQVLPNGTAVKLAGWTYDTVDKGQLYSAAHYTNGKAYGVVYPTRDEFYRPLRTRYVIPDDAGAKLAGTYEFTTSYNRDGTLQGIGMPAAGGLSAEGVAYSYDDLKRPTALEGAQTYVTRTDYGQTGSLQQAELNSGGKKAWLSWEYEEGTNRLLRSKVDRQDAGPSDMDAHYRYDATGNVLSIADTPVGGERDVQCFTQDDQRRLTEAWTSASTADDPCAGGPEQTGVGGPAAYHSSYAYDVAGNRTGETTATGQRTYVYGGTQPHALTKVTQEGRTDSYAYDKTGNTITRDAGGRSQSLAWDAEGHVSSVTEGTATTSFVYGPDGERMVRKDANATTVYLPGMELRFDAARNVVEATRYYTFGGYVVAVRNVGRLSFVAADHHGTDNLVIDAVTGALTRRRTTPFGEIRGAVPGMWPSEKGFVGGTQDPSGLVHLGAREYDPQTGRFLSDDPIAELTDPLQLQGYAYANSNPVTLSDPTGDMIPLEDRPTKKQAGGDQSSMHNKALALMALMARWYMPIILDRHGSLTTDLGKGGKTANTIKKAAKDGSGGNGVADMIFWSGNNVYIWEVKPNNVVEKDKGVDQLQRYVDRLQEELGDSYHVEKGPWLPPVRGVPTGDGKVLDVFSGSGQYAGLLLYGTKKPPKNPTPIPTVLPVPELRKVPAPQTKPAAPAKPGTGVVPIPMPNGVPYGGVCPGAACNDGVTPNGSNVDLPRVRAAQVNTGAASAAAGVVIGFLIWLGIVGQQ